MKITLQIISISSHLLYQNQYMTISAYHCMVRISFIPQLPSAKIFQCPDKKLFFY